MSLSRKELGELAIRLADELAPALAAEGVTLVLVLANETGWAECDRGEKRYVDGALLAAAEDAGRSDGWTTKRVASA